MLILPGWSTSRITIPVRKQDRGVREGRGGGGARGRSGGGEDFFLICTRMVKKMKCQDGGGGNPYSGCCSLIAQSPGNMCLCVAHRRICSVEGGATLRQTLRSNLLSPNATIY